MTLRKLPPKEAADLLLTNPENILITFPDFAEYFNITPKQMLKELQSGRLVAVGVEGEFFITGEAALDWMEKALPQYNKETEH